MRKVAKNIDIHIEGGYLQINGRIPVATASEELESFVRELKFQLFGEKSGEGEPEHLAPKDLNEKDAARYIGRSVSFLRTCRYEERKGMRDKGPKYTRDSARCIRYPVKELDKWLQSKRLYSVCREENATPVQVQRAG
jgi:hypothetical protein